ncbi:unnamed protein product [Caenorhabditis sp. 36 PRJEB53466]|nr:unnamed protein product [Caenorhabditis sp. 36 PRJEB53466]
MSRYDVVVYGASGFTGAYVVECLAASEQFQPLSFAVAGRSEDKLREVLARASQKTGSNVNGAPVIIADSSDARSLNEMARQAKVIINAVGPYRLHGEAVVKVAVENGASHVDVSGEPAWIEKMQAKYGGEAEKQGVYVVSACGWDCIPADLGVHFLKKNFGGDLNHVESFVQMISGPSGYCVNAATYQTLILGLSNQKNDQLGEVRKAIMPERIVRGTEKAPKRGIMWQIKENELGGYAIPFPGADRSVINRSQYYDATRQNKRPVYAETYFRMESKMWTRLFILWAFFLSILVKYSFTRGILQKYPDQCSFNMFKSSGPSKQQVAEASFVYWFFGYGYKDALPMEQQHDGRPDRKVVATCKGPDAGYIATSGCVLSAALTLILDRAHLPKRGGVYTTAAAFGNTKIYEYLASFGITYRLEAEYNLMTQNLLLLLLFLATSSIALLTPQNVHFNEAFKRGKTIDGEAGVSVGTMWQRLNHFSRNDETVFEQRYFYSEKYALPNRTVAFLFLLDNTNQAGVLTDDRTPFVRIAKKTGAALFVLEHRFYGISKPFETFEERNLGFLNALHAVIDAQVFIDFANKQFALDSDVRWIVWGAGYGGFLATNVRQNYPAKVAGAIASSAPLNLQYDFWEFNDHVEMAIQKLGGNECFQKIKTGFTNIRLAMTSPEGRDNVSTVFHLSPKLNDTKLESNDIQMFYSAIINPFQQIVQYNNDFGISINDMCKVILNDTKTPMESIYATYDYLSMTVIGEVLPLMTSYKQLVQHLEDVKGTSSYIDQRLWLYQICSQIGWFQTTNSKESTLFGAVLPTSIFLDQCFDVFPNAKQTAPLLSSSVQFNNAMFGGADGLSGSNLVLTNGFYDPWSRLGKTVSAAESVVTYVLPDGSHASDFFPRDTNDIHVEQAHRIMLENIEKWIKEPRNRFEENLVKKAVVHLKGKMRPVVEGANRFGKFEEVSKKRFATSTKVFNRRTVLLGRLSDGLLPQPNSSDLSSSVETKTFNQNIDHFNETDTRTFQQKFFKNTRWARPGGPNFLLIGGETAASSAWVTSSDLPWLQLAQTYGATVYMLEHRYYGDSIVGDNKDLSFLRSLQAVYDIAEFVNHVNQNKRSSQKWVTFGGSYSGSLSAWARELFPELINAAVASSAPVQTKTDFFEYLVDTEKAIRFYSYHQNDQCADSISNGFHSIHQMLLTSNGRRNLSAIFHLNPGFGDVVTLTDQHYFYMNLISDFQAAVQYNRVNVGRFAGGYGVGEMCQIMSSTEHSDLENIARFVEYMSDGTFEMNNRYLDLVDYLRTPGSTAAESDRLWTWQTCTELGYFQSADSGNGIFGSEMSLSIYAQLCGDVFGEDYDRARLDANVKTTNTNYGGNMNYQGTNTIFPIGAQDPWASLQMTYSRNETAISFRMNGAAHCADMFPERPQDAYDVTRVRRLIERNVGKWIESVTNAFHVIACLEIPIHILGTFCVIRKTPQKMANVKRSMLILHTSGVIQDVLISSLTIPYVMFPLFVGRPYGLLSVFGVPIALQVYFVVVSLAFTGVCILSVFENRYYRLFNDHNWEPVRRYYLSINYFLVFTFFTYPMLHIPEQEFGRSESVKIQPCITAVRGLEYHDIYVFSLNPMHCIAIITAMLTFVISQIVALFLIIYRKLIAKHQQLSRRTYELQKKFVKALFVQFLIAVLIFAIPILCILYTVLLDIYNQSINNICCLLFSLYGPFSTVAMIYLHQPYRDWIKRLFVKHHRKLTLSQALAEHS